MSLASNKTPGIKEETLTVRTKDKRTARYDFCFSVPKSVSILDFHLAVSRQFICRCSSNPERVKGPKSERDFVATIRDALVLVQEIPADT